MEPTPLKTFIIYAHEDRSTVNAIRGQLRVFEKKEVLQIWDDGEILAGQDWDKSIKQKLEGAQLILLFISVDFINSEYIEKTELQAALQRHRDGEAKLIPIIVRRCFWEEYFELGKFQALPPKGKPILSHDAHAIDEAHHAVALGIKAAADEMQQKIAAAEKARQEDLERENRQKVEAEKQKQKNERLQKQDEIAWKAALEAIKKAESAREKMDALEVYLDEPHHLLHRVTAEQQLEKLQTVETTRKIEEKRREQQRLEALRAKEAEKERLREQDEISWKATLEAIGMVKTEVEKIYFLEMYLNKPEHKIYRLEAEQQLEIIKADEVARRLKEEQRLEAERIKRAIEQAEREHRAKEAARLAELEKRKEAEKWLPQMVFVHGGTFQMGGNDSDRTKPIHSVMLSDFEIGKYPVTQKLWQEIMGGNPFRFLGCHDCPAEQVNWDDVQEFLKKLNQKYPGKNYRLPSEAEWEYAARGGKQSKGYTYAGSNDIEEVAWYEKNSNGKSHPVGGKKANELGLYDMTGNVWEWCQDAWHDNYQGAPTNGSAWDSSSYAARRVLRGGSWLNNSYNCRVSLRNRDNFSGRYASVGFRLARH